jgi:uncharacterized protein YigE (DUF2233 family)
MSGILALYNSTVGADALGYYEMEKFKVALADQAIPVFVRSTIKPRITQNQCSRS